MSLLPSAEKSLPVSKKNILLDASALLAAIFSEKGASEVEQAMDDGCYMTLVNLAEVVTVMMRKGYSPQDADDLTAAIHICPLTKDMANLAGQLNAMTQPYGLSLGDRMCLAAGLLSDMQILTADSAWNKLKLENLSVKLI